MRDHTSTHEATHAAVALHQGLTIRRLQVRGWVRVPRYCAQLYPGLIRGMPVRSPICLLEEDCLDVNPFEVLVAMAAPHYLATDDQAINAYAMLESKLACRYAFKQGLSAARIMDTASHLAAVCEPRIYEIAARLEQEGVIDGRDL